MNQKFIFQLFTCMVFFNSFSQELRTISWKGMSTHLQDDSLVSLLDFEQSIYNHTISYNNMYFEKIPISSKNVNVNILDIIYSAPSFSELQYISKEELTNQIKYDYYVATEQKQHYF